MQLNNWFRKWNVPFEAEQELRAIMGIIPAPFVTPATGVSEADVQSRVRLAAARLGLGLWRNNVGVAKHPGTDRPVRYGLANDSEKMNRAIKSSDLIGLRPIRIEPIHVGMIIGQLVSYEVKKEGWRYAGTPEEQAQLKWLEIINALGGHAKFITGENQL